MRLFWWDIVKHVKEPEEAEITDPLEPDTPGVDPMVELVNELVDKITKLRRDVDRIDRANYRAATKDMPPGDAEVPLVEPPPPPAAEPDLATVINSLRPGEPIPPQFLHLVR